MPVSQDIKVAVDAIVFGYHDGSLYVLLIKQKFGAEKGHWVLPGGFVKDNEGLKTAVARELKEETGIRVNYLEQLYTFGDDINRDPRGRVISVSYFALVNPSAFKLEADTDADDAQWFAANKLPRLGYDHKSIIAKAKERLAAKLQYEPIGFDLLGTEFPFSDLENLYSSLLGREIDRRNFRKKILGFGILEETGYVQSAGSGRPGRLYRFNKKKYDAFRKNGFHFEIPFA